MDYVIAMFVHRPYVVAVVVAFWIIVGAERGFARGAIWFAVGTFIGWLMEFSSVRTGFPFGTYVYHESLFPDELWLGGVPLFASMSFACLTYFGYSVAYTLLAGIRTDAPGMRRIESRDVALSLRVLVLATLLITWMDMVLDPVTHLGQYWGLGSLYHYDPPGLHFDVPLSNYAGWLLTVSAIVFVNQMIDRLMTQSTEDLSGAYRLPLQPFFCIAVEFGQYLFMLGVLVYLMGSDHVPTHIPLVGILSSTLILTACYIALVGSLLKRAFRLGARAQSMTTDQSIEVRSAVS